MNKAAPRQPATGDAHGRLGVRARLEADAKVPGPEEDTTGPASNPRYSKLEKRLQEWEVHGMHRGVGDPERDRAVIHSPNDTEFRVMTAVMDALHGVRRGPDRGAALSASIAM